MPGKKPHLFPAFPGADCQQHRPGLEAAVLRVLERGQFLLGPEVAAFEKEFATWLGAGEAVAVGSGTDAIELMLRALDIGAGDKVVLPSFAPSAVAAGVLRAGAGIVLADIDVGSFNLSPAALDAILKSPAGAGVKAALAIHLFGHPVDWAALTDVAETHGILLLEDAAQAHGATWQGRKVGTLGLAAAFSFYPTKNLGAPGDAGAVVTQDAGLSARLRSLREYGWQRRHISKEAGINSRMDELHAAVLRVKLGRLDQGLQRRRDLAAVYDAALPAMRTVTRPQVRAGCGHAWHLYVVRCGHRDALLRHLHHHGIPAAVHYPAALHQQPAYRCQACLPESAKAAAEVLTLPLHPHLSDGAVEAVTASIAHFDHAAG